MASCSFALVLWSEGASKRTRALGSRTINTSQTSRERLIDWLGHLSSGFCWIGFNFGVDRHWVIQFSDHLGLSSPSRSQLVTLRQPAGVAQGGRLWVRELEWRDVV